MRAGGLATDGDQAQVEILETVLDQPARRGLSVVKCRRKRIFRRQSVFNTEDRDSEVVREIRELGVVD